MAAPKGNQNATNRGRFREAIERALARSTGSVNEGLIQIALQVVNKAIQGDIECASMVADRLDGRPHQTVDGNFTHELVTLDSAASLASRLASSVARRTEPPSDSVH